MIKRGDKLQNRITYEPLRAIGNQTNSGEVLVRADNRRDVFYVRADMVRPSQCNDCGDELFKEGASLKLGGTYYKGPPICGDCDKIRYDKVVSNESF